LLSVNALSDKEKGVDSLEIFFVSWTRGYKLGLNKLRMEINSRFVVAGGLGNTGQETASFMGDRADRH